MKSEKNIKDRTEVIDMKRYQDGTYLREQLARGKTYLDIARENNIGRSTAQRFLNIHKLTKPSLDWTKQEIRLLKKHYGHNTNFEKYFPNRTLNSLHHKANRLGLVTHIRPRRYPINEKFFKKWTGEMAYVLGWMFSDGNVCADKRTFRIRLAVKDIKILEKIRSVLKTNTPIVISKQLLPSKKAFGYYATLRMNSYNMCQDLIKLGCTPNKTHKIAIPQMPPKILRHFVRGYFDGDGSIMFNKPNTIRIRIVGVSKSFIYDLAKLFKHECNIPINYKKNESVWQCEYYGDNARKICDWMYDDCRNLCLERKRIRFKEHLKKRKRYV